MTLYEAISEHNQNWSITEENFGKRFLSVFYSVSNDALLMIFSGDVRLAIIIFTFGEYERKMVVLISTQANLTSWNLIIGVKALWMGLVTLHFQSRAVWS